LAVSKEIRVRNEVGLHARPAALFVKTAAKYKSKISVTNLTKNKPAGNAKSILGVLSCGVSQDDLICITADGEDEVEALGALENLIDQNFVE